MPGRRLYFRFLLLFLLLRLSCSGAVSLTYAIEEEIPAAHRVGSVLRDAKFDEEFNSTILERISFTMLSHPESDRDVFRVEPKNGIVRTTAQIDRDAICSERRECFVSFDVAVQPVSVFRIVKVRVDILDINDNEPIFPNREVTVRVSEATVPGTSFALASASDPDGPENGIVRYTLDKSSTRVGKFGLQRRTTGDGATDLRLVLKQGIDRELRDFYQIRVVALDGGLPARSGSVIVNVMVIDANDNSPKFDNDTYEVHVDENAPAQTTLLRVHARDPDEGVNGEISYAWSKETLAEYGNVFGIHSQSGHVYTKVELDFEERDLYLLKATAADNGPDSMPAYSNVVVRVRDLNDNAPVIEVNTLTDASGTGDAHVAENAEPGAFVAHVSVSDSDSGQNGRFRCSLDNGDFVIENMYKTEYQIKTASLFNREHQPYVDVFMSCEDRGQPTQKSYQHIRVLITDRNDNEPRFLQDIYTASVKENNLFGDYLLSVSAVDKDDGVNGDIAYAVEQDVVQNVSINEKTGMISANTVFDHERSAELRFLVYASDRADPPKSASATVVLTVDDEDDERPTFKRQQFTFGFYENQPPGSDVGTLLATDRDSPPYNQFRYALQVRDSRDDNVFSIAPNTGRIVALRTLDRENRGEYNLLGVVETFERPPLRVLVPLAIHVIDRNDNAPKFVFPTPTNNTVQISNKLPVGHVLTRLQATDADVGLNAKLVYSNLPGGGDGTRAFVVDANGAVRVSVALERIELKQFELQVSVRDSGQPLHSDEGRLYVIVNEQIAFPRRGSTSLGENNLAMALICGGITFVISVIIIASICVLKRKDRRQRGKRKEAVNAAETVPLNGTVKAEDYVVTSDGTMRKPHAHEVRFLGSDVVAAEDSDRGSSSALSAGSDSGRGPSSEDGDVTARSQTFRQASILASASPQRFDVNSSTTSRTRSPPPPPAPPQSCPALLSSGPSLISSPVCVFPSLERSMRRSSSPYGKTASFSPQLETYISYPGPDDSLDERELAM